MTPTLMPMPRATYRLQLRPDFDFTAAAEVADYLAALGVSHLYSSPSLQAAPGSTHGYDVVDPSRLSRDLGGEAGHARLRAALGEAGLGQIMDIVPNHMAIAPENRWWWDVLRNGPASGYAPFFDVDWDPPEPKLRDQVLMPILGDHYGRELEQGDLVLERDDAGFRVRYHDHVLPLAPRSLGPLLEAAAEPASELAFLGRAMGALPEPGLADAAARRRRQADLEAIDRRVAALLREPERAAAVDRELAAVSSDADRLDALLSAQNYRLAYWRTAGQELDYRRFFDIDTLAGLRVEDREVFDAVHARVLEWVRDGVLDGLRVDHPDGLRRPGEYFRRLREEVPDGWIVVEKILMPDEELPDWPVDGTTGYDLLNDVTGLFVDPAGERPLTDLWTRVTGDDRDFHAVAREARHDVLREVLGADVNRLANIFVDLCESRRRYRDFTRRELREVLVEVAARFPVYRTYVGEEGPAAEREERATARDRAHIDHAIESAAASEEIEGELLDFLRSILVGDVQDDAARGLRMRFQQLTGPVAAKGEEDTAFYRYNRLVALNEVGGDPGRWGLAPSSFHERMERRAREWPAAMNALSTHDTKRSEDVRARLVLLSEIPDEWAGAVEAWRERTAEHWPEAVERDPGMELLLYQTLVGAWPISEERTAAYMEKAMREAKLRTAWTDPDEEYEGALRELVAGLYASGFTEEVAELVAPLIPPARTVSLAQKLVQLTAPGVPDVYQGSELWDLSLVDPDNRRPVDFDARRRLLERLDGSAEVAPDRGPHPEGVLEGMEEGLPKLHVVRSALRVRRERPAAFAGGYRALESAGAAADHVVAFVRGEDVAVVVPRLPIRLEREGGWRDTVVRLPEGRWRNALGGEAVEGGAVEGGMVEVSGLLAEFPVALLVREEGGAG